MAKFKKGDNVKRDIKEVIGVLNENDKNDWCKALARISWNDGPSKLEIRQMNMSTMETQKGIGLTDEETDRLTDLLLNEDYGSIETLESALKKRKSRFTVSATPPDIGDEPIVFDFDK